MRGLTPFELSVIAQDIDRMCKEFQRLVIVEDYQALGYVISKLICHFSWLGAFNPPVSMPIDNEPVDIWKSVTADNPAAQRQLAITSKLMSFGHSVMADAAELINDIQEGEFE